MKKILTSVSDFKRFIQSDGYYSDKTDFIKQWMNGETFTLITRPRRFGKTLNLSMLKYFFSIKCESKDLFSDLAIGKDSDFCRDHMNKYPVINMSFKDIKDANWGGCYEKIKTIIAQEYDLHTDIVESLNEREKNYFDAIRNLKASFVDYQASLKFLSEVLKKHHGKGVILLIDEYDTPLHNAYNNNYYEKAIAFFRDMYGPALKENAGVERSLTTGILRVSKESIFSGMNNLSVSSVLGYEYSNYFGFTQEEVDKILTCFNRQIQSDSVKKWYNGYKFGDQVMYNPWSVSNFAKHGILEEYWINTGNTELLDSVLAFSDEEVKKDFMILLEGESVNRVIEERVSFPELIASESIIYGLLLSSGYLTWSAVDIDDKRTLYTLKIPNIEVNRFIQRLISIASTKYLGSVKKVFEAVDQGDWESFKKELEDSVLKSVSSLDIPKERSENLYHMYILGMMIGMSDKYEVISNRESGRGRYDIAMYPRDEGKSGVIFEFKNARAAEELSNVAQQALQQIDDHQYEADFKNRGFKHIWKVGIAFRGQRLEIKYK